MKRKFCSCNECDHTGCNELCRQMWHYELQKRKALRKKLNIVLFGELKQCAVCGNQFLPKNSRQKYCGAKCSYVIVKNYMRNYKRDRFGSQRQQQEPSSTLPKRSESCL